MYALLTTEICKRPKAKAGKTQFYISALTPTVSTMAAEDWRDKIDDHTSFKVTWDESIEVVVITLDQLIEQYGLPDFCKIDVEDFEVDLRLLYFGYLNVWIYWML